MTIGGIPLIYLGDEVGTLNDYSYLHDPVHKQDSRWVHRPKANRESYDKRHNLKTIEGHVYQKLQNLIKLRKEHDVFSAGQVEIVHTENDHVLGFVRSTVDKRVVILANFSETPQIIQSSLLERYAIHGHTQLHGTRNLKFGGDLIVEPLDFLLIN